MEIVGENKNLFNFLKPKRKSCISSISQKLYITNTEYCISSLRKWYNLRLTICACDDATHAKAWWYAIAFAIYILRLKTKKLARTKIIPASPIYLMKSCFAGWNPSKLRWNLRCATSDEIKSASINPALAGFHHKVISSTKCIYSDEGVFS